MVCEVSEPQKRQNTHNPQFCTRDVDRLFCGGGVWTSRSYSNNCARKRADFQEFHFPWQHGRAKDPAPCDQLCS